MDVFGVAAPSPMRDRVIQRLTGELETWGRTAVVERAESGSDPATQVGATMYHLADSGMWTATGREADLEDLLARLAPDHDYAVVLGWPDAAIPHVVVGTPDYSGDVVVTADEVSDIDAHGILTALEELEPYETLDSLVTQVKRSPEADRAGAIATFTGRVRERDSPDDAPTTHLEFQKYDGIADERMADIRSQLETRDGVYAVEMHHRTGVVASGEDIVFVVVLAGHREEAFETVRDGINRLKAEVPLFKKEVTVEDEFWVHERPDEA